MPLEALHTSLSLFQSAMLTTHAVGIDLGTTYSCIAYLNEHGEPVSIPNQEGEISTPSVVMYENGEEIVGTEALRNAIMNPQHVVQNAKRWMGDPKKQWVIDKKTYNSVDVSAAILGLVPLSVFLLGHSFGAVCSMEVSLAVQNLAKVVLYEPMIPIAGPITPPQLVDRMQTLSDAGKHEEALTTFFRDVVRMPEIEIARARMLSSWSARVAAAHTISRELREVNKYVFKSERFSRIASPVLLLLGGDSPAFVSEGTNAVHAAIPSSRVTIMPGQQHIAMDTAPAVFLREVIGFFRN